jgi:hypothetical protein
MNVPVTCRGGLHPPSHQLRLSMKKCSSIEILLAISQDLTLTRHSIEPSEIENCCINLVIHLQSPLGFHQ